MSEQPTVDFDLLNKVVKFALEAYPPDSSDRYLYTILDVAVWRWTERGGKYKTGFVTEAALARREANKTTPGRWLHQDLQHEHVLTKKDLISRMRAKGNAMPIRDAVACVVTKEEHLTIKSDAQGWQRYVDAGIKVLTDNGEPVDLAALAQQHPIEDLSNAGYGVNGIVDGFVYYEGSPSTSGD